MARVGASVLVHNDTIVLDRVLVRARLALPDWNGGNTQGDPRKDRGFEYSLGAQQRDAAPLEREPLFKGTAWQDVSVSES
jgi:hypothetical protein